MLAAHGGVIELIEHLALMALTLTLALMGARRVDPMYPVAVIMAASQINE